MTKTYAQEFTYSFLSFNFSHSKIVRTQNINRIQTLIKFSAPVIYLRNTCTNSISSSQLCGLSRQLFRITANFSKTSLVGWVTVLCTPSHKQYNCSGITRWYRQRSVSFCIKIWRMMNQIIKMLNWFSWMLHIVSKLIHAVRDARIFTPPLQYGSWTTTVYFNCSSLSNPI